MPEFQLSTEDNDKTLTISPDDIVVIQLPEIPSTGYRWSIIEMESQVLTLDTSDFIPASNIAVGGGGVRKIKFTAREKGMAQIHLKLQRAWIAEDSTREAFNVTVKVGE